MKRVQVEWRNTTAHRKWIEKRMLGTLAQRLLTEEGVEGDAFTLSVLLCDDETIRRLKKEYWGIAEPTDVLSFPQPPVPGASPRCLGDIVISLDTVMREVGPDKTQAAAYLRLLFVHGLLHLLGYDHTTPAQRRVMRRKQAYYLNCTESQAWPRPVRATQDAQ
jgi:probable rRNA maturation factor